LYFIRHAAGAHTLVIADNTAANTASADASAYYRQSAQPQTEALHDWRPGWNYRTGKWVLHDYDFTKPSTDLTSTTTTLLDVTAFKSWERYEYPGWYTESSDGDTRARARMEAEEAGYRVTSGAGTYAGFCPGQTFSLAEYPVAAEAGQSYALVSVEHEAADNTQFAQQGATERPYYANRFSCIPDSVLFRPQRTTPRPVMRGPQTALVVGPQGDEIHCDTYGRIRVQFPWDRLGQKDDKSSCFVRVAQSLAGRNWGTLFTPRVGMEVVVDFLDGNPDRPLVTGAVYNAENMPPWALPDNKNQSGFLSRSTTQGTSDNANELRFVDTKGSELLLLHAEKDFTREVENDDKLTVGHDQTTTITNNRTLTVSKGDETHTVETGNHTFTVKTGNQTVDVKTGNQTVTVDSGNRTLSVKAGDETITVHGNLATTVETGNHSTTVSQGNHTVTVSTGDHSTKASTGSINLEATQGIQLKCGENSIKIDQSGITLNGMNVTLKGSVQVQIQGAMATLKGDGTVTIKGGMVMIN
jgi:type VI secretion system secreted protein VgrG